MQTIKVFGRLNYGSLRVYPYTEEAKTFLFSKWIWPDVIKMFLGKKISLTPQECLKLEKEGVCKFIQCIDPILRVEGMVGDYDALDKEYRELAEKYDKKHCPGCNCYWGDHDY